MFKITLESFDIDETRSMIDELANLQDCEFKFVHITDGWEGGMNDVAIYADNMFSIRMVVETFDLDIDDVECAITDDDGVPVDVTLSFEERVALRRV